MYQIFWSFFPSIKLETVFLQFSINFNIPHRKTYPSTILLKFIFSLFIKYKRFIYLFIFQKLITLVALKWFYFAELRLNVVLWIVNSCTRAGYLNPILKGPQIFFSTSQKDRIWFVNQLNLYAIYLYNAKSQHMLYQLYRSFQFNHTFFKPFFILSIDHNNNHLNKTCIFLSKLQQEYNIISIW